MKHISVIMNTILAAALVLMMLSIASPSTQASAAPADDIGGETDTDSEPICDTGRTIQVSGTAVVNVVPDRVLIQLGIQSNGKTPQKVEADNSATINRIIRSVRGVGVDDKDIVTDHYVIQPVYNDYDSLRIEGYRIYNIVAITLRDISKVNRVIITALNAGANQVVDVEFYLSNLRKYRDQARDLAMKAAQEKAEDIAAAAGAKTGCVMNINENTWSNYYGGWYGQRQNLWTQNTVQNAAPAGETSSVNDNGPVNLGQISVRAEVSASFSLK